MIMASSSSNSNFGLRFRSDYEEFCSRMTSDFVSKLYIDGADDGLQLRDPEDEAASVHDSRDSFESAVSDQQHEEGGAGEEEEDEDDEEEFEFSFAGVNPDGSPVSADDVFQDGQIRPIYPLFDRSLLLGVTEDEAPKHEYRPSYPLPPLKKLFVEVTEPDELDGLAEGTYCVWNGKTVEEAAAPEPRKSNSTGFSKLWRFRDLVHHRSNSDGKDAFVFLNGHHRAQGGGGGGGKVLQASKKAEEASRERTGGNAVAVKKERRTATTAAGKGQTAHEKHYVKNRAAKESDRRRSYLPYRQDLVGLGFFTNVSGMSRNVHPF